MNYSNEIANLTISKLQNLKFDVQSKIRDVLMLILNDYSISKKTDVLANATDNLKLKALQMFFVSKKVEGCTDNTLKYYSTILKGFFNIIEVQLDEITANDIRFYLAKRSTDSKISKASQDNELRVLKSFFKFCVSEDYIIKNPTSSIKPVKKEKRVKKAFSEIEIEKIRESCDNLRDKAIVEVLYSTGVRVSELSQMDKNDLKGDEIVVFGKGEKERIVFLNAKSQLFLNQYLKSRTDNNFAMFVSLKKPFKRMSKGAIEVRIRKIGEKAQVAKCYPHRFRRTTATYALNRGMPIEQVSQMLGHEDIETTTIYARSEMENVKSSHKKYVT